MKFILTALLVLSLAAPAHAAPAVSAEGASALKALAETTLKHQEKALKSGGMTLLSQGEVVVEEAGTYYALTTPMLTLQLPGGITRTIGMVAINAIPTDNPNVYKMAVALPTPIVDTNASGATVGQISIGTQSMNGLYNFTAQHFTELKGDYQNFVIDQPRGTSITARRLSVQTALTDQGQGLWSGPTSLSVSDLTVKDARNEYTIKEMNSSSTIDGADLLSANLFRVKLQQALLEAASPARDDKVTALIRSYLGDFANGIDLKSSSNGITFKKTFADGKASAGTLASSNLTLSLKNIKSDNGTVSVNSTVQGLTFDDPKSAPYAPSQINIQANATGVALKKMFEKSAQTGSLTLKDLLSQPGSKLNIQQLDVQAQAFGMNGTADLTGQPGTSIGAYGTVKMNVRGMEALNQWLMDPNGAAASGITVPSEIVPVLTVMQLAGVPSADGASRNFDVSLSADGKMVLNGAPLQLPNMAPKK